MKRRICIVTGSRAEYGLLTPLMREISADDDLNLLLVVTGMHLSPRFGNTAQAIADDGFTIDARVDILEDVDTPQAIARAIGRGVSGIAEALTGLEPHIVVLPGDRFEILAAATAAMALRLPIAQIHGGEVTAGAMDDAIRHAITKLAHLHFVAAEPYRRRVIQLGEAPERVFAVGAPGLDNLSSATLLERPELERDIGAKLDEGFLVVTYHPATLSDVDPVRSVEELLHALDQFPERRVLLTGVNTDLGHAAVAARVEAYARLHPDRVVLRYSLGQRRYLSALKRCAAVIGNSSSGIIEAPALDTPTVNIGARQEGRLRAASIVDCVEERAAIVEAIRTALNPRFMNEARRMPIPYGRGGASKSIKRILKETPLGGLVNKRFYDLPQAAVLH